MTRDQKIEESRRLRAQGKSYREIGDILGHPTNTIWGWLNPEARRAINRRTEAKPQTAARKRAWERENDRQPCAKCGRPRGIGAHRHAASDLCAECYRVSEAQRLAARDRQIEAMWAEGLSMRAIAAEFGWSAGHIAPHMAYADPPYIGQSKRHYRDHPDYAGEVEHFPLIGRLVAEYPDGWALSLRSPTLYTILDYCHQWGLSLADGDIRVMAWVKPFCAYKRNVRVAYAWEPIIVKPARRLEDAIPTRDFIAEGITMKRGLTGVKPDKVCRWLFEAMGLRPQDQLDDLFPGSGAVSAAWDAWRAQGRIAA